MSYEWFVARRYLTARRKQAFISVITAISVLGITIGVMALIIAIALITGFQNDVQDKILDSTAHIIISDMSGGGVADYPQLISDIEGINGVITATPVIQDTVLLQGPYKSTGAMVKGLDFSLESEATHWIRELELGRLPDSKAQREEILLGRDMAFNIGASLGDVVTVLTLKSRLSPLGMQPRIKRLRVAGIFFTGLYEFDSATALITLNDSQNIFDLENRVNHIQVKIEDIFKASEIKERLKTVIPEETYATTWMEMNKPLFSALKLEKQLMFFTITLIVFVAALNIIATLILMVMEKTRDIGILKAMGTTTRGIRKIFFFQGAMIGILGTGAGTALGLLWCWLANMFELIKVPADIYHIAFVPFRIDILDLLMIVGVALLISFLSTLFPSYRAAKVDPVKALKYE